LGSTQQDSSSDISWRLVHKLTSVDKAAMARYGQAVAVWGESLIVGAAMHHRVHHETNCGFDLRRVFTDDAADAAHVNLVAPQNERPPRRRRCVVVNQMRPRETTSDGLLESAPLEARYLTCDVNTTLGGRPYAYVSIPRPRPVSLAFL
jgi:hypothetical protein